jgi:acyl-CoA synthetase (AMP-forming)/AMP-acid ligase II
MTTATGPFVYTSGQPDVAVPDRSLPDFLLAAAPDRTDRPALVDGSTGRTLTYGGLADGVARVAAGLAARGLAKGGVLALMAPNSPEWLLGCYGAMAAGGVVTGVNPLYTAGEVATQLAQTGARFVLVAPPFLETARSAVAESGLDCEIVLIGPETAGCVRFDELLRHPDAGPAVRVGAADLAMLPCSSGTSGLPKSVMLSHRACVANVLQQRSAVTYSQDDRVLAVAPFFHATGFAVVANGVLDAGGTVVTMPRFDVEQMLGLIERHRITATVVVPPIVLALAKHPAVDRYDLSSLRWVACGAAPLGAELQQACAARLGRPVVQGYGMTELTAGIAIWPVDVPVRPGAAGRLLAGLEARVVDLATGADLPPGGTGELWWRGQSIMDGYLGDPAATAATIDADGWVHSGDIGRIDPDGALFVVDRVKELIKVKGFQVAPAELEAVLRTHPDIAEAAVVPMPDERAGERPKAFVVRSGELAAADVLDWVARRVAPHKRLGAVEFIDAVPTSPAGKTLRRLLRARS